MKSEEQIYKKMWNQIRLESLEVQDIAWTEYNTGWVWDIYPFKKIRQALVRDSESWTDSVTYWSVDSCLVRVINERLVENKTLVLLWAETKQARRHTANDPHRSKTGLSHKDQSHENNYTDCDQLLPAFTSCSEFVILATWCVLFATESFLLHTPLF